MSDLAIRPLVAGNWKMNGRLADGTALAREVATRAAAAGTALSCDVLVCPPATLLTVVGAALAGSGVALGAQDCHWLPKGAHTGDISAPMLADMGCSYVILGHSERRALHHEDDATVGAKASAALDAGLIPVICVGETAAQYQAKETLAVIERQVIGSVPPDALPAKLVVAYEPVWAIGTGLTPTASEIDAVHAHIRAVLGRLLPGGEQVRILYGGSVKPSNAPEFMALPHVDGALLGGASLVAEDFWAVVNSVPMRTGG
ncbi:MAG TPA: triose-phosphate isomerase [Stellaceae bacterium]|nr:triose-phosphate isomerase [Stellaceae bacterium]